MVIALVRHFHLFKVVTFFVINVAFPQFMIFDKGKCLYDLLLVLSLPDAPLYFFFFSGSQYLPIYLFLFIKLKVIKSMSVLAIAGSDAATDRDIGLLSCRLSDWLRVPFVSECVFEVFILNFKGILKLLGPGRFWRRCI